MLEVPADVLLLEFLLALAVEVVGGPLARPGRRAPVRQIVAVPKIVDKR
jgi:hypothetical protein